MSETFQVTARKWRPMRFDEVVGQEHITRTLKNAIAAGRLAHGYLFTGQRGCGKTTVARILAKAVNCPNAPTNGWEPCNTCASCKAIIEGNSMDVHEIDGASNTGVDDVRALKDNVKYPPMQGAYRVVIIDEVHMLSTNAFNALLKTLEEPPSHLLFIFATTEVQKVLPTILSRTQRYDFRRIQLDEITAQLRRIADAEAIMIDDDALLIIAKKGDGSMRDAQSIFDQVVAYCGRTVVTEHVRESLNLIDTDFYFGVSDAIAERRGAVAFGIAQQIVDKGYGIEEFFVGLLEHFRNLLTVLVTKSAALVEVSNAQREHYQSAASAFTEGDLIRLIRLTQSALERTKFSAQPRITLEVALVEMTLLDRAIELQSLMNSIESMKQSGPAPATQRPLQPAPARTDQASAPSATRAAAEKPAAEKQIVEKQVLVPPPSAKHSEPVAAGGAIPSIATDTAEIDSETVRAGWDGFVESLRPKRSLHMFMPEVEFCGVRRSLIYLSSESKNALDLMTSRKADIVNALREYYRVATLTIEIGDRDTMHARSGMPLLAPTPKRVEQVEIERAPIEDALMRELGAKEVV